jgi:hypothetical protein
MTRCSRCLYDESIPGITFDAQGVCSYCHLHDRLDAQYPAGKAGWRHLERLAERIKADGAGKRFDVVVGISGGCDSSLTLWTAVKLGLRPVAVHFDNSWNTATAEHNMEVVTRGLGVPLVRHTVLPDEFDQINRAFLLSGVRDFEAPTDLGHIAALFKACEDYDVKTFFTGHSFRTEGLAPLGWSYMDAALVADVCKRYGGPEEFRTFPNLWLKDQLRWAVKGLKRVRILWWIDHNKEQTKRELADTFDWRWYGGHHRESEITDFFMWMARQRMGIDFRLLGWSALIRSGQMERNEALAQLPNKTIISQMTFDTILARLGFTESQFYAAMAQPVKTERDFRTYRKTFRRLRPLFWLLVKRGTFPPSFYIKYCKG